MINNVLSNLTVQLLAWQMLIVVGLTLSSLSFISSFKRGDGFAVRYKQTIIGVAWAILRPFLTMIVFTVIFGRVTGAGCPNIWASGATQRNAPDMAL